MQNVEKITELEHVSVMKVTKATHLITLKDVDGSAKPTMIVLKILLVLETNVLIRVWEHVDRMLSVKSKDMFLCVHVHWDSRATHSFYAKKNL